MLVVFRLFFLFLLLLLFPLFSFIFLLNGSLAHDNEGI